MDADLSASNLQEADLSFAKLTKADLTGTNLVKANLDQAILAEANLTGADLTEAELRGTNLNGANMEGVRLLNAVIENTELTEEQWASLVLSEDFEPLSYQSTENLDTALVFAMIDELEHWTKTEEETWEWLLEDHQMQSSECYREYSTAWSNLKGQVANLRRVYTIDPGEVKAARSAIYRHLKSLYDTDKPPALLSTSPKGHFVLSVYANGQEINLAAYVFRAFLAPDQIPMTTGLETSWGSQGLSLARAFEFRSELLSVDIEAVAARQKELSEHVGLAKNYISKFDRQIRSQLAELREGSTEIVKEAKKTFTTEKGRLTDLHKDADEKFKALEETYNEQLTLEAPVGYWKGRKEECEKRIKYLRNWVLSLAPVFLGGLWILFSYLMTDAEGAILQTPDLWRYGVLIGTLSLMIWPIRYLLKLLSSNYHLRTDAEYRATMVNTFLALLKDSHIEPEHRQYVLEALFRPTDMGIIKEDQMQLSLPQLLSRVLAGK